MHIHFAVLSLCCIPAVNLIVDGGRALFAKVEVVVSDPGDMRGKQDETSETGASTTWPHPHCSDWDNSPGNSLILPNEPGWLRACFGGGKKGSWELWKP